MGIPVPNNNLINGKMFFDCPNKKPAPDVMQNDDYVQIEEYRTPTPDIALAPQPTKPAVITCNQDNELRALERFSTDASTFCPSYLSATTASAALPTYVSAFNRAEVSTACTCFEAGATEANTVITIPATSTAPTLAGPTLNPNLTCMSNASISQFNFTSGKVHRLRLINAGAEALQRFVSGQTQCESAKRGLLSRLICDIMCLN